MEQLPYVEHISERLAKHYILALDTSIFIYHLEAHPTYLPLTRLLLRGIQEGQWQAVTSVVTLMELTVHPWRLKRSGVAREYETLLVHFPHLTVVEITREVARRAAQIRAWFNIRHPHALQVAAGLCHGATAFVTNDRGLMRLGEVIDIILLTV